MLLLLLLIMHGAKAMSSAEGPYVVMQHAPHAVSSRSRCACQAEHKPV
jgi:hypothetical protein